MHRRVVGAPQELIHPGDDDDVVGCNDAAGFSSFSFKPPAAGGGGGGGLGRSGLVAFALGMVTGGLGVGLLQGDPGAAPQLRPGAARQQLQLPQVRPLQRCHVPRISPFLRYAKYSCQDKAEMLMAFAEPTVLEIGSQVGEEWADLLKGATHVWAVEPSPSKKAAAAGRLADAELRGKVDFFSMAISSQSGVLSFLDAKSPQDTVGRPPPWISQAEFDSKAVRVNASTLDDFWKRQMGRRHITMLKIDTQGHEPAVISGGQELFATDPPDIIHMEFSPKLMQAAGLDGVQMLEFIYGFGYLCFDCLGDAPVALPPLHPDKRGLKEYGEYFAKFMWNGADHGGWTDLVCLK